jgi:hypothetical protein
MCDYLLRVREKSWTDDGEPNFYFLVVTSSEIFHCSRGH